MATTRFSTGSPSDQTVTMVAVSPPALAGASLKMWDGGAWVNASGSSGPTPSSTNPAADGVAAPGTSTSYARGDHVHPTDTTLAPKTGAVLTGATAASTPAAADNSLKLSTTAYSDRAATNAAAAIAVPAPSSANPIVNGAAAPGTATPYSRADHVHPTDTTLAPKTGAVLTSATAASTPAAADNSLKLSTTAYADRAATNAAPAASSTNPLVNGTAAPGTAAPYSRQDHVHPTDTTRAPLNKRITTITSSATPAVNVANTDAVTITAQAVPITSMTSGLSGTASPEQPIMWRIHATAAVAITWGTAFITDGVTPLPVITVANKTIRVGTIWDEVAAKHICVAASVVGY
jgi:hypothetical protein